MLNQCENCWETYDTERHGANEYFCPKCSRKGMEVNDGLER